MSCCKPASSCSSFSGFDVYFGNYHCNLSKWGGVSDLGPWLKTILQSIFMIYWYCYIIRSGQRWRKGSSKWDLSRVRNSYLYYYHKCPLFHVWAISVKIWILQVNFTQSNLHLTHIFKHSGQGFYSLAVSGLCMNRHCMRGRKPIENDEPQRLFCRMTTLRDQRMSVLSLFFLVDAHKDLPDMKYSQ